MDDKPDMNQMTDEEASQHRIKFRRAGPVLGWEATILALAGGAVLGALTFFDPIHWLAVP